MSNRTLFKKSFLNSWILIEKHQRFYVPYYNFVCDCSYCKENRSLPSFSFGLWIPKSKTRNAWWVFYFKGTDFNYYLRFTLPFLKKQ